MSIAACKTCGKPKESEKFLNCESCRKLNRDRVYRFYDENPEKRNADEPDVVRRRNLRSRHGITEAQLTDMIAAQDGVCLICACVLTRKNYHIDHDHNKGCCGESKSCSNCRRGVLCNRCNTLVGRIENNMELIDPILEYIGAA